MKVSLVTTVLNEQETIAQTLDAIDAQSRGPDETLIVDGGSADDTLEIARSWAARAPARVVISSPGASIGAGRNLAIRRSSHQVIAVTDAGCVPRHDWLQRLLTPLEDETVDVAMGFYEAATGRRLAALASCLNLPGAGEIDEASFMPSSRSIAFRKMVWEDTGGYPEWLEVGEDMNFDFRVRDLGFRRAFAQDAVVEWRLPATLRGFLRQYFRYARGDGLAGMNPRRHALRFAAYAFIAIVCAFVRHPIFLASIAAAGVWWLKPALRRAWFRLAGPDRFLAFAALPLLNIMMDIAKMAGYLAGRRRRSRRAWTVVLVVMAGLATACNPSAPAPSGSLSPAYTIFPEEGARGLPPRASPDPAGTPGPPQPAGASDVVWQGPDDAVSTFFSQTCGRHVLRYGAQQYLPGGTVREIPLGVTDLGYRNGPRRLWGDPGAPALLYVTDDGGKTFAEWMASERNC